VKESMLNVVPQKMDVYFMGTGCLSAVVAEMSFKGLIAIFTGNGHIS
jgi:hypothetical protein